VNYTFTQFTYVYLNSSGGAVINTDSVGETNAIPLAAVVNLPSSITINGTTKGLLLDLQISASATLTRNSNGATDTYSIKPTFNLTAISTTTPPSQLPKVAGLDGRITATDTANNSFTLTTVNGYSRPTIMSGGSSFSAATNASTLYQGVQSLSDVAAGMFVNLDLALQPDGSLLATRVEVDDPNATNVMTGPLSIVYSPTSPFASTVWDVGRLQQGSDLDINPISSWGYSIDSNTAFKTSEQLTVPSNLPFSATFNSSNMVDGQNVSISSLAISSTVHATTITLRPQTIDGTVAAVSSAGNFAIYTVNLATYDLFPTLAVQPGQTTALQNPTTVEVFTDSLTRMLNTSTISPGSGFRFHGLVFNDNGSLRMYCNQVNDGVPE